MNVSAAAPACIEPDARAAAAEGAALAWPAQLQLTFARRGEATQAVLRRHHGPLRVQRMLYPEGPLCCHALLHPPGGIAGGDALEVMRQDTARMRGDKPFVMTDLRRQHGLSEVIDFIRRQGLLEED